jgi:uncharacterized protein
MNLLMVILNYVVIPAGIGLGIYGGQLFLRQRRFVFRPSREMTADPTPFWQGFDDLFLHLQDRTRVNAWFIPRDPAGKLVLFLPGSVGNLTHEFSTLAFLLSFNVSVLTVEYPGFGKSQGRPGERACYAAADAIWRHAVEEKGIDPGRIILFGRCLGATVAAWLAARYQCAGLVCLNAWTSVPDLAAAAYPILPARYFCYVRFNTLKFIRNCRCPVLFMHADHDRTVPSSHSVRLFEKAQTPKRLLSVIGDHFGNDWQASPNLRNVLAAILNGKEQPAWN